MTRFLVTETDGRCHGYASAEAAIKHAGADATIRATDDASATTRPLTDLEAVVRTTRHRPGSRYDYDFTLCIPVRDCKWAQMDTEGDAPWFGQWANPFHSHRDRVRRGRRDDDQVRRRRALRRRAPPHRRLA